MRHRRHNTAERKPQPRQTRVTGVLDVIRHSTHSFSLKLEDRIEVRGVVKTREQIEELKKFLGKKLLVLGRAVYRTSGKLLRIDAEGFETGEGQPLLFAKVPPARATRPTPVRIEPSSRQRQGVPAFFGTWPGEETDEDFNCSSPWLSLRIALEEVVRSYVALKRGYNSLRFLVSFSCCYRNPLIHQMTTYQQWSCQHSS